MKKPYLLVFFLASFLLGHSQTLLNEDFESGTFQPAGWTLLNGNVPGNNWTYNSDPALAYVDSTGQPYPTYLGTGAMVYETDSINANAWAITPSLSLTSGVSYTISFYYRVASDSFPEKLKVTVGSDATINGQSTILWNNNGGVALANDSAWTEGRISYTSSSNGNFHFGFNCYSDSNRFALVVDNIKVEGVAPPCATRLAPANGTVNVSAPQALFTWNTTASQSLFKLGTSSTPDSVGYFDSPKYYSNLAYNTTYYWTVVPKNSAGSATGCPVYSFTTQSGPPVPANDEPAGAIAIGATGSVSASTKGATQTRVADSCNGDIGNANDDVWFTFTPLQSGGATIILTPEMVFDGVINAYAGSPGAFVSLSCADQGYEGQQEMLTLTDLVAGQTYYFRVFGFGDAGKDGAFTLTGAGTTLPVNITTFKGEHSGSQNILSWTTQTEENNKGFELQRSANGRNFTTLAFINSKAPGGNSTSMLSYNFADVKPFTGNAYYRLKQVDLDGRSKTTNIVLLKGLQTNTLAFSNVYPNPAKNILNMSLAAPAINRVNFIISDLAGKPILQQSAQIAAGDNTISINVNKLPSGTYMIKAVCANGCETAISRFIKQ